MNVTEFVEFKMNIQEIEIEKLIKGQNHLEILYGQELPEKVFISSKTKIR